MFFRNHVLKEKEIKEFAPLSKVDVAFICDSHYVLPTVVAITSLIDNKNKSTHYNIYVVAADISNREAEKFREFCAPDIRVYVIDVSLKKFEGIYTYLHISSAAYLKFDLPNLIPELDKVLYLDSDVVIQRDMNDLFDIDISDHYLGAVIDIGLLHGLRLIRGRWKGHMEIFLSTSLAKNNTSPINELLAGKKTWPTLNFLVKNNFEIKTEHL